MGIGFVITIALLSALLGMFARQALAAADEKEPTTVDARHDSDPHPHSKAM